MLFTTVVATLALTGSIADARPLNYRRQAAITDFGSCGSPEINFAVGLDGRKDPSFQAVNQADFNHGSALNAKVITEFICGQLKNKCKAPAATQAACDKGDAAAQALGKTGAAADAFNAAFGIKTNLAAGDAAAAGGAAAGGAAANAGAVNDFGSCGSPEIQFGAGLDGRKENSFQAINLKDFNHGSALNAKVITEFVCGQLKSKCKASAAAIAACDKGDAAAQALGKVGAAADTFNAAFGIKTNFAAGDAAAAGGAAAGGAAANAGSVTDFGSCGSPEVQFGAGLDGRKENSFQAVNLKDFNHGSALNAKVITEFICGQLKSKCKASAAATAACDKGDAAAQALGKSGAAADAFNAAFGIKTNFANGAAAGAADAGAAAPAAGGAAAPAAGGALNLGTCTDPSVKFGLGFDGRKELSFINNNSKDFAHGSALNPGVIFQSTCDTLVNKCGLKNEDQAVQVCRAANTKASALGKSGAAADVFNAAFGIKTNFAAVKA